MEEPMKPDCFYCRDRGVVLDPVLFIKTKCRRCADEDEEVEDQE